jgi:hypothetical protein
MGDQNPKAYVHKGGDLILSKLVGGRSVREAGSSITYTSCRQDGTRLSDTRCARCSAGGDESLVKFRPWGSGRVLARAGCCCADAVARCHVLGASCNHCLSKTPRLVRLVTETTRPGSHSESDLHN